MAKSPNAGAARPRKPAHGRFEKVRGHARSVATEKAVGGKATPMGAGEEALAPAHAILAEAQRSGLLDGEKSEHISFRAPPALIEAAKRETGGCPARC